MSYLISEPHLNSFTLRKEQDGISRNYNRKNVLPRFFLAFFFGQLSCVWQWAKCLPASRLQIFPSLVPAPGFPELGKGSVSFSGASQVKLLRLTLAAPSQFDQLVVRYNDDVLYFRQTVPWYDGIGSYLLFQINDSHGSLQIRETPIKNQKFLSTVRIHLNKVNIIGTWNTLIFFRRHLYLTFTL